MGSPSSARFRLRLSAMTRCVGELCAEVGTRGEAERQRDSPRLYVRCRKAVLEETPLHCWRSGRCDRETRRLDNSLFSLLPSSPPL